MGKENENMEIEDCEEKQTPLQKGKNHINFFTEPSKENHYNPTSAAQELEDLHKDLNETIQCLKKLSKNKKARKLFRKIKKMASKLQNPVYRQPTLHSYVGGELHENLNKMDKWIDFTENADKLTTWMKDKF